MWLRAVLLSVLLGAAAAEPSPLEIAKDSLITTTRDLMGELQARLSHLNSTIPMAANSSVVATLPNADVLRAKLRNETNTAAEAESSIISLRREQDAVLREIGVLQGADDEDVLFKSALEEVERRRGVYAEGAAQLTNITDQFVYFTNVHREVDELRKLLDDRVELEDANIHTLQQLVPLTATDPTTRLADLTARNTQLEADIAAQQAALALHRARAAGLVNDLKVAAILKDSADAAADATASRETQLIADHRVETDDVRRLLDLLNRYGPEGLDKADGYTPPLALALRGNATTNHTDVVAPPVSNGVDCEHFAYRFTANSAGLTSAPLPINTDSFTLAIWLRPTTTTTTNNNNSSSFIVAAVGSIAAGVSLTISVEDCASIRVDAGSTKYDLTKLSTPLCDGQWHQLLVSWNGVGGEAVTFVDGKFRGRHWDVAAGQNIPKGSVVTLGAQLQHTVAVGVKPFQGLMADVFYISAAVVPTEVVSLNREKRYPGSASYFHWELDQAQGNVVNDTGTLGVRGTTHGGKWIGIKTHGPNDLPGPDPNAEEDTDIVFDCADRVQRISSGGYDPLAGPQGIPASNGDLSVGHLNDKPRVFINPYALPTRS